MSACDTCKEHSGLMQSIKQVEDETVRQGSSIDRMDAKLNMIIGAIILSPFLWQLLTGTIKLGGG